MTRAIAKTAAWIRAQHRSRCAGHRETILLRASCCGRSVLRRRKRSSVRIANGLSIDTGSALQIAVVGKPSGGCIRLQSIALMWSQLVDRSRTGSTYGSRHRCQSIRSSVTLLPANHDRRVRRSTHASRCSFCSIVLPFSRARCWAVNLAAPFEALLPSVFPAWVRRINQLMNSRAPRKVDAEHSPTRCWRKLRVSEGQSKTPKTAVTKGA